MVTHKTSNSHELVRRVTQDAFDAHARKVLCDAIAALDDEGFMAVAWDVYQKAKTAGGYADHEGWRRVLDACLAVRQIADLQKKFDAQYAKADAAATTVEDAITDDERKNLDDARAKKNDDA